MLIGLPGTMHRARALHKDSLFEEAADKFCNGYTAGDAAYPLLSWLMTTYKKSAQSSPTWKIGYKCHSQQSCYQSVVWTPGATVL